MTIDNQLSDNGRIRSFVRRAGRITHGQKSALDRLWSVYGIPDLPRILDPDALFASKGKFILEIGFGNGEALVQMATAQSEDRFLGVEVYTSGIGRLLSAAEQASLSNLRVVNVDAVELLRDRLEASVLDQVCIWFPDPWPKKRHHKRRLIQPDFVSLLATRIKAGGRLLLATDWAPYAEHMLEVMEAHPAFDNLAGTGQYSAKPEERPTTKFERRGLALGHAVYDLVYRRKH